MKKYFLIILFITSNHAVFAQASSPIFVEEDQVYRRIGAFIALGQNFGNGKFLTQNCNCYFENGVSFGFTLGALYEHELSGDFLWGCAVALDSRTTEASYREYETITVQSLSKPDYSEPATILTRNRANLSIMNIMLEPYIKFEPWDFMFVRFGAGVSFPLSSNIKHEKENLTKAVTLMSGEYIPFIYSYSNPNPNTIEDGKYELIKSPVFTLEPIVGFYIPLSKQVDICPMFQYSLPINPIAGDDYKVGSWRIAVEISIKLGSKSN